MDAAHVGSFEHEIFNQPFSVRPAVVSWPMPENYKRHPEAGDLPEKTNVWLVQNSGKKYSGAVSAAYNFEGGPDDESLVAGCNSKAYPHTAIGRHGNFLQWGFGEPPTRMTEDGRELLVNCICYIRRFAGRPPLVRKQAMNRRFAFHYKAFSDDLTNEYKGREAELYQLHKDNIELLRYEEKRIGKYESAIAFPIDFELKDLGITSNRRIATLEQLISLLPSDPSTTTGVTGRQQGFFKRWMAGRARAKQAATARKLLRRYTDLDFGTRAQWQKWLDTNRQRLFFSDFGGYRFYVASEDLPDTSTAESAIEPFWFPR